MAIYDRPTWALLEDCLKEMPEAFTSKDVVDWFARSYSKIDEKTVRQHLRGVSANDGTKRHMRSIPHKDLVFKKARGEFVKYDGALHGQFDENGVEILADADELDEVIEENEPSAQLLAFALERHLEDFLDENIARIHFGRRLSIYESEDGLRGRQFPIDHGRIDLLCLDEDSGDLVVVELKKGRHSDAVVGQCLRYMGWVKQNLASPGQGVKGIIITRSADEHLKYATSGLDDVEVRCYEVTFQLSKPF